MDENSSASSKTTDWYALPTQWVKVNKVEDCPSDLPQQDLIRSNVDRRNTDRHVKDSLCGNCCLLLLGSSITIQTVLPGTGMYASSTQDRDEDMAKVFGTRDDTASPSHL
jgi:hypothetical protein